MYRFAVVALALVVSIDQYMYSGKFAAAGVRASTSMLQHFGLL